MATYTSKSISAVNTFTDAIIFDGNFNLSISVTLNSPCKVTAQRSIDGSTYHDVDQFSSIGEFVGFEPEPGMSYKFGIKSSETLSGSSVTIRVGGPWKNPPIANT